MKLQIKKSFVLTFLTLAVFYDYRQLFLFILAVFFHETCHLMVAKIYKLKVKSLTIMPLGTICITDSISKLSLSQKIILNSAGILGNLILFILLSLFDTSNIYLIHFKNFNFLLFIFNSLPIYPLDGSKNYLYIFGYIYGHLLASKKLISISKFFSILVIIFGFLQMILNPFNLFIYVMGVYLYKKIKKNIYGELFFDFYKNLTEKHIANKNCKIKACYFNESTTIKQVLEKISLDSYLLCYFTNNNVITEYTENEILQLFFTNGLNDLVIKT